MSRPHVLAAYREALRLIARLPLSKRGSALSEARQAMRENINAPVEQVPDLMRLLVSKISYLRMCTPKQPRDVGRVGFGTFVVRDGKIVEGRGASQGRAAEAPMPMEEAWQKHRSLMKRQYFGREPPRIPGIF